MSTAPTRYEYVTAADGKTGKVKYQVYDWRVGEVTPDQTHRFTFYHTCTADLNDRQIEAKVGDKEFGEGFYTTGSDVPEPYRLIATEWFQRKQERYDWHVVAFTIMTDLTLPKLRGEDAGQDDLLRFYLSHSTGYPSGSAIPNDSDIEGINMINRFGRVLIFPHMKDKKVAFDTGKEEKSWYEYTAPKSGGGPYRLIIGPQQPEYMGEYRQYAWVAGWGVFLINSGLRFYAIKNYKIDAGYRKALDGSWPKGLDKRLANGEKAK